MKELLDFMNTLAISGNSVRTCVRSITASVARDITRVVIDSKPDVQRRRAASEAVLFTESRTLA
jgi:hypothetical protein